MKKYISYFAILLASVVLFSCTNNNDFLEESTTPPGEFGNITLQAVLMPAKEVNERKANEKLAYQNEDGAIKMTWKQGDFLQLFDSAGNFAATFTITSISSDNVVATFNISKWNAKLVIGKSYDVYAFDASLAETQNSSNPKKPTATPAALTTSFVQDGFTNMDFLAPYTILATDTPLEAIAGATDWGTVNLYAQFYSLLQVDVTLPDTGDYVTGLRMTVTNPTPRKYYMVSVLQDSVTTVPAVSSLFIPVVAGTQINAYTMDVITEKGNVYQFSGGDDPLGAAVAGFQYKNTIADDELTLAEYTWQALQTDIANTAGPNNDASILYLANSLKIVDTYFGYSNSGTIGGDGSTESTAGKITTTIRNTINRAKQPKKLTFPNWVEQVNTPAEVSSTTSALFGMNNIKEINAPELDSLMNYAFYNCSSLQQLNVPKLRAVGGNNNSTNLFAGTPLLEAINLPALEFPATLSVGTFIGTGAKSISVGAGIKAISPGIIDKTTKLETLELLGLIEMPLQPTGSSINFLYSTPDANNYSIKTINLPALTTLRNSGFQQLKSLETLNFNSLEGSKDDSASSELIPLSISKVVFENCNSLTDINFGSSPLNWNTLTSVGNHAFTLTNIESLIAPELTNIDDGAFSSCYNLKTVKLEKLTSLIQKGAFYNCYNLEELYIPNVNNMGPASFLKPSVTECVFGVADNATTVDITINLSSINKT